MGGRSPVAWLVAVAVAMGFVVPLAFAPASAQISVPLPGTDSRPRVVERKQIFRPTAPYRNPNRVAASIAAVAAPSTSSVSGAVIASAAGGLSAASGALKADPTVIARTYEIAEAPADTAAPPGDTEADASASDGDGIDTADAAEVSPSDDPAPDVAAEESAGDESEATDVATADDAATSESEDAEAASDQGEAALASEDTKPASEPQDTADANAPAETATPSDDAGTDEPTADVDNASSEIMLAASTPESAEDPAEEADDKDNGDATDAGTAQADAMEPEATEPAASSDDTDTTEPQTAEATDTEATETEPADAETAGAQEADQEPEPAEVADTPSDETTATDSTPVEADDAEAPPSESETADAEPAEPTDTKTAESEEPAQEAERVETAEVSPEDTAAIESEPAETAETETASAPSHDATVVLAVSPPPDEVVVAALTPADAETPSNDDAAEEPEEPEDVAALTPPSEPEPVADPASESETPTAAEPESDSDDDADEAKPEEAAETPTEEETPSDTDPATATGEESEEGETPDETVMEPPPPPAHPIVATVRDALAAPDAGKSVASADLEALKTFYGSHEGPPLWVTEEGFTPKAQTIIAEVEKADEWGLDASSFELPPPNDLLATPNAHANDELQLSIAILSYARDAQIGRLSPSKVSKLFDQHPSLRDPKTVLTEIAAADDPSAYLLSLHPQHDQFKRLRAALAKARASADAKGSNPRNDPEVQRIVINMERWRWMPRSLGTFHVWNNIPAFNVRVVKNGKTVYLESTIVGQLKYATVFFSAPMRNIVFHPDWTVPPTIVKEDLAPKLEQGGGGFFGGGPAAALRRHGLSASLAGQPVDANSVDWKNENIHRYTFTQAPGPANVLGKLKFNFPNKHAIYMHDTIQPELFSEPVRTLSHGCIRVQDPDQFAALLLGEDKGWSHAQVRGLLATNETSVVSLNRHIPVHLTYFTATVDENGKLNTFGDIYGLDNRMAAYLFDNPARFHVPPTPAVVDAAPRTQRRQGGGGLDGIISGLFGN